MTVVSFPAPTRSATDEVCEALESLCERLERLLGCEPAPKKPQRPELYVIEGKAA